MSEYEIILVNDGSTDNSLSIIENLATKYPNISILSQKNERQGSARNKGLSLAKGEYVWFIDSDDWIKENCLLWLYGKMEKYTLDVLRFNSIDTDGNNFKERYPMNSEDKELLYQKNYIYFFDYRITPCSCIFKISFLIDNKLCFMKGIVHEDNEFVPRMYYYADNVMISKRAFYYYYANPESTTRSVNPQKAFDLLKVVDAHLNFVNSTIKEQAIKVVFYNCIGIAVNAALNNVKHMDKKNKQLFYYQLGSKRSAFKVMLKSNRLKYKAEALLFLISPVIFRMSRSFFYKFIFRS
jgi:glycosyltransferase involved in cell wall biosynthesis